MKCLSTPRPWAVGSPTLSVRAGQRLHAIDELEDAKLTLEEKRWEAIEWMRAKRIAILGREHEGEQT